VTLSQAEERLNIPLPDDFDSGPQIHEGSWLSGEFRMRYSSFTDSLRRYKEVLDAASVDAASELSDDHREWETLKEIDAISIDLSRKILASSSHDWLLDRAALGELRKQIEQLRALTGRLPTYLEDQFEKIADDVKARYRAAIISAWIGLGAVVVVLIISRRLFNQWFADPLQTLV